MKPTAQGAVAAILALCVLSCEEPFEPKAEFEERPILYCVLTGSLLGRTHQTALLHRTYDVEGYDPRVDSTSHAIRGANVVLSVGTALPGAPYPMADTLLELPLPSRYGMYQPAYMARNVLLRPGEYASLRAELPSGAVLQAETVVPPFRYFELSYEFRHGITTRVNRLVTGPALLFSWDGESEHLYDPRFILLYAVRDSAGVLTPASKEIPLTYVRSSGSSSPLFPRTSHERSVSYDYVAIDSAMAGISAGDPEKSRYVISGMMFRLLELDGALSRYVASIRGGIDDLSIRQDANAFTNIVGGIGVFGSYTLSSFSYTVDRDYALSFGYSVVGN